MSAMGYFKDFKDFNIDCLNMQIISIYDQKLKIVCFKYLFYEEFDSEFNTQQVQNGDFNLFKLKFIKNKLFYYLLNFIIKIFKKNEYR